MTLDVGVQERIRRHIEELCLKAKLSGSFMKPVKTEVGRWEISLSYGTTEEMEKLEGIEAMERERRKLPKRERKGRPAPTWHLAAKLLHRQGVEGVDFEELGMIAASAGAPKETILSPIETISRGAETVHWQWCE